MLLFYGYREFFPRERKRAEKKSMIRSSFPANDDKGNADHSADESASVHCGACNDERNTVNEIDPRRPTR